MTKRNPPKKFHNDDQEIPFDFSEYIESSFEDDMVSEVMGGFLQTASQHMHAAVALTKIAVDKNPAQALTDRDVFETFKKAYEVIQEVSPLKRLWNDLS